MPAPSRPRRFSTGTSQSSKKSSLIGEVRIPILRSLPPTDKPLLPRSTMNALMPFGPFDASTVAKTTITSAIGPFVTQVLLPLRR
ncbi:MAG: hypothetical protein R3E53_07615 [Myxococcota bacterium]